MPAIPIYRSSPITAAKPDGVTPKTAAFPQVANPAGQSQATTSPSEDTPYPQAQPGARPFLPAPTGAAQPQAAYPAPTPTQKAPDMSPPAPQPGAVPKPPGGGASNLPPPPRAGEHLPPAAPQITPMPMPPQMFYAPPTRSGYGPARSSTTTTAQMLGSQPTSLPETENLSHPPGYQQNINASEFTSDQREAHNAFIAQNSRRLSFTGNENDEGVWDTAKKWAVAAGESLAAAENEVWRRINKEQ